MKRLAETDYKIIVISNAPAVARGMCTEKEFMEFHKEYTDYLKENGARIDDAYYCFHHPIHGIGEYKIDCECRKPKPGMLIKAIKDLNIDPQKSILIGDKVTDTEAGKLAKIKTILQLNNSLDDGYAINIKQVSDIINYL